MLLLAIHPPYVSARRSDELKIKVERVQAFHLVVHGRSKVYLLLYGQDDYPVFHLFI